MKLGIVASLAPISLPPPLQLSPSLLTPMSITNKIYLQPENAWSELHVTTNKHKTLNNYKINKYQLPVFENEQDIL